MIIAMISKTVLIFQYDATRYMYIIVESPSHIIRGEQVGVRVTIFNYWYGDEFIEVRASQYIQLLVRGRVYRGKGESIYSTTGMGTSL